MKKLVVFDLDGTLLDTIGDIMASVNEALSRKGLDLMDRTMMKKKVGNGLKNALLLAIQESTESVSDEEFKEMYDTLVHHYNVHPTVYTEPYDGILELLEALQERGIQSAVFSNKRHEIVRVITDHFFPKHTFAFVLGHRAEYPLKPNPQSMLEELDKLGIGAEDVVYVGDSEVDKATAENAGMDYIIVNYGFRSKEELEAKGVSASLDSVPDLRRALLG